MSRALIIVRSALDRQKAAGWVAKSPPGTRITFQAAKRTVEQNDKMWAMLTEVAEQATHQGKKYTPDEWKVIFMHACGREVQFIPSLDGKHFIPWGDRSSKLSKDEMSDLIEFIAAWGTENGVRFHDYASSEAA